MLLHVVRLTKKPAIIAKISAITTFAGIMAFVRWYDVIAAIAVNVGSCLLTILECIHCIRLVPDAK
jgi:hypothetical protein